MGSASRDHLFYRPYRQLSLPWKLQRSAPQEFNDFLARVRLCLDSANDKGSPQYCSILLGAMHRKSLLLSSFTITRPLSIVLSDTVTYM